MHTAVHVRLGEHRLTKRASIMMRHAQRRTKHSAFHVALASVLLKMTFPSASADRVARKSVALVSSVGDAEAPLRKLTVAVVSQKARSLAMPLREAEAVVLYAVLESTLKVLCG